MKLFWYKTLITSTSIKLPKENKLHTWQLWIHLHSPSPLYLQSGRAEVHTRYYSNKKMKWPTSVWDLTVLMTKLASAIWFYLFMLEKNLKKLDSSVFWYFFFWNTICQSLFEHNTHFLPWHLFNWMKEMLLRYYYRVLVHDDHYLILRS